MTDMLLFPINRCGRLHVLYLNGRRRAMSRGPTALSLTPNKHRSFNLV